MPTEKNSDHCHSTEYEEYIHSQRWIDRCKRIYKKRGRCCERCGRDDRPLQMHHKNYDRLGHELDEDLQIVCRDECHPKADAERIEWEARRISQIGMKWATLEEVEALTMRLVER